MNKTSFTLLLAFALSSSLAFAQTTEIQNAADHKEDTKEVKEIKKENEKGSQTFKSVQKVNLKKKSSYTPVIAPIESSDAANCASNLGGKGDATFTACEAGKNAR